jgi:hypothetical protein
MMDIGKLGAVATSLCDVRTGRKPVATNQK